MTVHFQDDWLTVHLGDCREVMASMEPASVHCVVTSPPYWGLRDYGTATWVGGDEGCDHLERTAEEIGRTNGLGPNGFLPVTNAAFVGRSKQYRAVCGKCGAQRQDNQLGLEATPEAYVEALVGVFREVRRVLRDDGTVWLNLGDSYAGGTQTGRNDGGRPEKDRGWAEYDIQRTKVERRDGLKPKDLVGIPWRVAFALQADGWYLRSDIIWSKPNPMPESVTDRPTKSHEMIFLLAKSARYFFDADAVREGVGEPRVVQGTNGHGQPLVLGQDFRLESQSAYSNAVGVRLAAAILERTGRQHQLGLSTLDAEVGKERGQNGAGAGTVGDPIMRRAATEAARFADGDVAAKEFLREVDGLCVALPDGHDLKELRTSSTPAPLVYSDGDRAVAVDDSREIGQLQLIHDEKYTARRTTPSWQERKAAGATAGSKVNGHNASHGKGLSHDLGVLGTRNLRSVWTIATQPYPGAHFATFPSKLVEPCVKAGCPEGGVVLDPFAGSGTTGLVANRLGRRAVLIDLSADYLGQVMVRNAQKPLGLEAS